MPATISFFDMSVSITPPAGHFEPQPLTNGPNYQANDVRMLFVGGEASSGDAAEQVPMDPDPPTGFTSAYSLALGSETAGVYYRRLVAGDSDTSVAWPKPPSGWRDFYFGQVTARGVDPGTAPTAGLLTATHTVGDSFATVTSVAVPAAGAMLFMLGNAADPEGGWPSWPCSMGTPTGWTAMVATDKSGPTYYAYDANPSMVIFGKNFASSGTTGSVTVPISDGSPAFLGMYCFLRPAPDVSTAVGAA